MSKGDWNVTYAEKRARSLTAIAWSHLITRCYHLGTFCKVMNHGLSARSLFSHKLRRANIPQTTETDEFAVGSRLKKVGLDVFRDVSAKAQVRAFLEGSKEE